MMTRLDQPHLPRCMCEDKQAGFPHLHGSQLGWREIGYQITSCVFFFNLYIWKMQFSQPGFIVSWKTCLNDVWSGPTSSWRRREQTQTGFLLWSSLHPETQEPFVILSELLHSSCQRKSYERKPLITCKQLLHLGNPIHYGRLDGHQGKHFLNYRY